MLAVAMVLLSAGGAAGRGCGKSSVGEAGAVERRASGAPNRGCETECSPRPTDGHASMAELLVRVIVARGTRYSTRGQISHGSPVGEKPESGWPY